MKKYLIVVALFLSMLIIPNVSYAVSEWDKKDVPIDKIWTITFSDEVDINSVNENTVRIVDNLNNSVPIKLKVENDKVVVTSIDKYKVNTEYLLQIKGVSSITGNKLVEPVEMKFTTVNNIVKNMRWDAGVYDSYWGYYSGEILNGVPHGLGEWIGDEIGRSYKGVFENGKFHGNGKYTYPDGYIYEGDFVEGEMEGYGTLTIDGLVVYSGKFIKSEMVDHPLNNISTEYDYVEDITWLYDKERYENGIYPQISLDGVFPYIGQRGDNAPWLRLVIYTQDKKWYYPKEYIVRTDNNIYTITPSNNDMNRKIRNDILFSWDHLELLDMHVDNDTLEMLYDIVNSKNNVYVRVKGSNDDWDILLADKYKIQIKNVLDAYEYLNNFF